MRYSNSETLNDKFMSLRASAGNLYMSLSKRFVQKKGDNHHSLLVVDNPILFMYHTLSKDDYQFVWAKYFAIPREEAGVIHIYPDEKSFIEREEHIFILLSDIRIDNVHSLIRLNEELEKELSK
ncbi:MAG: hypothetical protein J5732_04780 [Bacteroidaceae bacterium]|nr:hypothetical protein [Bacteroidaceae bacterium]